MKNVNYATYYIIRFYVSKADQNHHPCSSEPPSFLGSPLGTIQTEVSIAWIKAGDNLDLSHFTMVCSNGKRTTKLASSKSILPLSPQHHPSYVYTIDQWPHKPIALLDMMYIFASLWLNIWQFITKAVDRDSNQA